MYAMSKNTELVYDDISESAKFREQYRFIFSAAIVATVFVIPNDNIAEQALKVVLGFSAFFSALYLIASAACVKYYEPKVMYIFDVYERLRMRMYDFSVDVVGFALIFFVGIVATTFINFFVGLRVGSVLWWIICVVIMFVVAVAILLVNHTVNSKKPKKAAPRI